MVGPPRVVAGEAGIRLDRTRRKWGFARPPASDEDRHSAEIDKDLWSAARDRVGGDRGAEHLTYQLADALGFSLIMWM